MSYKSVVRKNINLYNYIGLGEIPKELIKNIKSYIPKEWSHFIYNIRKELIHSRPEFYIYNYKEIPDEIELDFISRFYNSYNKYLILDKKNQILFEKEYKKIINKQNQENNLIKDNSKFIPEINLKKRKLSKTEFIKKYTKQKYIKKDKIYKRKKQFKLFQTTDLFYRECENCFEIINNTTECDLCINDFNDLESDYYDSDQYDYYDYYY
jgi:hypothetical protein